jgi:hypothetical protein
MRAPERRDGLALHGAQAADRARVPPLAQVGHRRRHAEPPPRRRPSARADPAGAAELLELRSEGTSNRGRSPPRKVLLLPQRDAPHHVARLLVRAGDVVDLDEDAAGREGQHR